MLVKETFYATLFIEVGQVEEVRAGSIPARERPDVGCAGAQIVGTRFRLHRRVRELGRQLPCERHVHS